MIVHNQKGENMKKLLIALIVVSLVSGMLFAAGQQEVSKGKVVLKLATIYAPDHPVSIGLDNLVKTVAAESGGRLEIQHFPAAQLGNEPSIHEGLRNYTIDMAVMGISEVGKRFEPVLVFDAPFIFRDADHMMVAFNSDTGNKLWSEFENKTSIKMMAPIYYGTRILTTTKPVPNVATLKGMKIRVPDQPNSVDTWKALGATPTPMNLGEVYLSLQTGVVDGQENPLATIVSSKFHEVCKFFNLTYHSVQSTPLFMSTNAYNKLDAELKDILDKAIKKDVYAITENIKEYEVSELESLAKQGITLVEVERQGFIDAAMPVINAGEASWGKGIYQTLQNM
jgi:tripartite ATP-independent transporter DctP family solute receptor